MTGHLWAVLVAAFLASAVEFVEAFTIVLVVGVTINWRSALAGALVAAGALAVIVAIFGVALVTVIPLDVLRLVVGVLLVLFGLKWLKKAILRYAGLRAMHDEEAIYEEQLAEMKARGERPHQGLDPFGVVTSFKSALLLVVAAGAVGRAPLQRVPENTLKFVVGLMLTSFGTFWGGEGLGIDWAGEDLFLLVLIAFYLTVAGLLVLWLRPHVPPRVGRPARADTPTADQPISTEVAG
jgi:uncharacterized membrane protein